MLGRGVRRSLVFCGGDALLGPLNAPSIDRTLTDGPGSCYRMLKEREELALPGGGKIRKQIIAGAECEELMADEALLGARRP